MHVIIGLGNPGTEYQRTRHNLGFYVVDMLARRWDIRLSRRTFLSLVGDGVWRGEKVLLVQPQTYMNRSGDAAVKIREFYHLSLSDFVIVQDDLDLPVGRVRIKRGGGGAGGNRGIASLITSFGSKEFVRVKVGIGRPPGRQDPADFVLQPFTRQEEASILPAVEKAADAVEMILTQGLDPAMAIFNVTSETSPQ
ncbi:MAG: aminoacyl-tRNA hydrolase [Deltaproteobacteria bacterium]|nr:aminoacyl-tRNA hydrolase [Deltaproteobacteria bacterium]